MRHEAVQLHKGMCVFMKVVEFPVSVKRNSEHPDPISHCFSSPLLIEPHRVDFVKVDSPVWCEWYSFRLKLSTLLLSTARQIGQLATHLDYAVRQFSVTINPCPYQERPYWPIAESACICPLSNIAIGCHSPLRDVLFEHLNKVTPIHFLPQ